jgi:ABC-2 type transport system permease protein
MGNITEAATTTMPGSENIINQLMLIDFNTIFTCSFIYFIFGYLLYASFYAWIGSTLENPSEGQQITLIATLPLCIALYIALYIMQDPESSVVWWSSMIPLTSPIVMIARLPYGVPTWELVTSIVILFASFIGSTWIAARIYRTTILMYGKNVSIKEVIKHFRQA